MIPIITLLLILSLSLLITRIATIALTYTGLSYEVARFQARSAFTGVGFTTNESETVVNHPVRRKILLILMLFGNAGIITVMASLVLTFIGLEYAESAILRVLFLVAGLAFFIFVATSKWVEKRLAKLIDWALKKYTKLDVRDYVSLLHMAGEFKVTELYVDEDDWLAEKQLDKLRLQDEGVMILGITRREGKYIGAPDGSAKILPGDTLVLYGRGPAFDKLDQRRKGKTGDKDHEKAVAEHMEVVLEEKLKDPAEETKLDN